MANSDIEKIYQVMLQQAEKGMIQTCERIKQELTKYVQDNWYNRDFTPEYYDRTFEFINSISSSVKMIGNTIEGEIYFDTSKIHSYSKQSDMWGQHTSLDGQNVSDAIPYYIEYGNGNSSAYAYNGVHMVQNVTEWAEQNQVPIKEIFAYMKKQGIQATII